MAEEHRSSSHVQRKAENALFLRACERLGVTLEHNARVMLESGGGAYIQPDFYSEEKGIIGEIFAHVGSPKKAQDNKIANDILKMLLLEKIQGREYRKILVVCDRDEEKKLKGRSALAESIRRFGIEIMYIDGGEEFRNELRQAQARQRMTNAE